MNVLTLLQTPDIHPTSDHDWASEESTPTILIYEQRLRCLCRETEST